MAIANFKSLLNDCLRGDPNAIKMWREYTINKTFNKEEISYTLSIINDALSEQAQKENALFLRGLWYRHGIGGDINFNEAIKFFERAISGQNYFAMHDRARMHQEGLGGPVNYPEAIRLYEEAIRFQYPPAMCHRGLMYENGLGGPVNHPEAIRLYEEAINLGNPYGMACRALMHYHGRGGDINDSECIRLLEDAIKLDVDIALYNRGALYYNGRGGERDYDRAFTCFREYEQKTQKRVCLTDLFKDTICDTEQSERLDKLYASIYHLSYYGRHIDSTKGEMLRSHATALQKKLDQFVISCLKKSPTPEEERAFKMEFIDLLKSKDIEMGKHRHALKPIIFNIIIALSGVGFIALLTKMTIQAISSHINNTKFSLNKACFFATTASENLAKKIECANNWTIASIQRAPLT